ncbi:MAG: hypothetical protein HY427_01655 [Candidatus Levybacteria bacterium]|nr:hypothetical protein [Candidatus Levybacteria bacterium]
MPDGENREKQQLPQGPPERSLKHIFDKPPVQSRITEPDPDYVPGSAPKPIAPEEAQKAMFRETAKKLAAEEEEILAIARKVNSTKARSRLPSGFHISQWGEKGL